MKHSIHGFSQIELFKLGLTTNQILILRWFVDFKNTDKMKKMTINGKEFYWIHYQTVLDELPILYLTNREALAKNFDKMVKCGLFEKHVEKSQGTYTYFRIVPETFTRLISVDSVDNVNNSVIPTKIHKKHPTQKSSMEMTPDSKVDPNTNIEHPTQNTGATRLEIRPKDSNTSDNMLVIVSEAKKNLKFLKYFNDFCLSDEPEYRETTANKLFKKANEYNSSLADIISALKSTVDKNKVGELKYIFGILKNKSIEKSKGINFSFGLPEHVKLSKTIQLRLSGHLGEYGNIGNYEIDYEKDIVYYSFRKPENYMDQLTKTAAKELLNCVIAEDVYRDTGKRMYFELR